LFFFAMATPDRKTVVVYELRHGLILVTHNTPKSVVNLGGHLRRLAPGVSGRLLKRRRVLLPVGVPQLERPRQAH